MKRLITFLLAVAVCLGLLTACGAGSGKSTNSAPAIAPQEASDMAVAGYGEDGGYSEASQQKLLPEAGRKIIYNANLSLESKQYADTLDALLKALAEAKGYVQNSEQGGNGDDGNRWVHYTFRIPSTAYNSFLESASNAGNLVRKSESTEDVTAEYVDVEARLDSLKTQETRLLELAEQAEKLEDFLAIEEKLGNVRYQIESYTGQKNVYDNLLTYSTVEVYLDEVQLLTPVANNFGNRLALAFKGSWRNFVNGLQDFTIGLVYFLPTLIVLAVIAVAAIFIARNVSKRNKAKAAVTRQNTTVNQKPGEPGERQTAIYGKKDE